METSLRIIYTQNIRGDLDLLPRMFTFLQILKRDLPPAEKSFLVDLGNTCEYDVWHCDVTAGRSTLLVLDAMGYDVVNAEDDLTPESRAKLREHAMLNLVDADTPYQEDNIRFGLFGGGTAVEQEDIINVNLLPADEVALLDNVLRLISVNTSMGQVAVVQLRESTVQFNLHTMPPKTRIDPTIAGAVDFVISEARYAARRRKS